MPRPKRTRRRPISRASGSPIRGRFGTSLPRSMSIRAWPREGRRASRANQARTAHQERRAKKATKAMLARKASLVHLAAMPQPRTWRIAGKSITADSVADIPLAGNGTPGVVGVYSLFGLVQGTTRNIYIVETSINEINKRSSPYKPITPNTLDYAVKAAMCDGKGAAWTDAEQAAARERMGLGNSLELIEAWELDHDETMVFRRNTTPSGEPYRFKELRVVVRHANGSGITNVSVGAHSAQGTRGVTICYLPVPGSGDRLAAISASAVFGTINALAVTNVGSKSLQGQVVSTPDSVGIPLIKESDAVPNFDYISSFEMSNALFKAGCKICIYGVWA